MEDSQRNTPLAIDKDLMEKVVQNAPTATSELAPSMVVFEMDSKLF